MFSRIPFILLALFVSFSISNAQAPPSAGLSVDSTLVRNSTSVGYIDVFLTNSSSNATSLNYIFHAPGMLSSIYSSFPGTGNTTTNPVIQFDPFVTTGCNSFEVTQIATNAFGADTTSVVFQSGCSCLTKPVEYGVDVTIGANGAFVALANTNGNASLREVLGYNCPINTPTCSGSVPNPGDHVFCGAFDNGTCTSTQNACDTVTFPCWPATVAFTYYSGQGFVQFTDISQGHNIYSWAWDFGEGAGQSSSPFPIHNYAFPGTYLVCLTIYDSCGIFTFCDSITVCYPPVAYFSHTYGQLSTTFTDQSLNGSSSFYWEFGDGDTSTTANPVHVYSQPGTYIVCLTTTNACGTDTHCDTIQVSCGPPNTFYSLSSNQLQAIFTDQTQATPGATYNWTFGDAGTSTLQNPTHTYAFPGVYQVCLTVTDQCGTNTYCQQVTVTCTPPSPMFSFTQNQLQVDFSDLTTGTGPFSYSWSFGDAGSSLLQNPSHTYASNGTYQVCLTVSDTCGDQTYCDSVTISIVSREEAARLDMDIFPNPSNGKVKLSLGGEIVEGGKLSLWNIHGRQVGEKRPSSGSGDVFWNLEHLPAGVYYLTWQVENYVGRERIILQK